MDFHDPALSPETASVKLRKRRALVIHPSFRQAGGANCVAAWALQALYDAYDITLFCWDKPDIDLVNAYSGTSLITADIRLKLVPAWQRWGIERAPLPLALVRKAILENRVRTLLHRERFDLIVATGDEIDAGQQVIQYVHFPWRYHSQLSSARRWYQIWPLFDLYRGFSKRSRERSNERVARNITLVNSAWTGRLFEKWYHASVRVVYPPVPIERKGLPWAERADAFICIGRISPEKRILEMIDIVAEIRRRGYRVSLEILGHPDTDTYVTQVKAAAAAQGSWVSVALDAPREYLLDRVAHCRFGLHGMAAEHFGIAIAEMIKLGCVVFAPDDGGPAEILGGDTRLLYSTSEDAVDKICTVLSQPSVLDDIRAKLHTQADTFSAERFVTEFRQICDAFADMQQRGAKRDP